MEDKIIEFVKKNSYIYDKSRESYKNADLKFKKWKALADELKVPSAQLQKRWKSLKDCYHRAKRRMKSGNEETGVVWKYFEKMKFLDDCPSTIYRTSRKFEIATTTAEIPTASCKETCSSFLKNFNVQDDFDDFIVEESESEEKIKKIYEVRPNASATPSNKRKRKKKDSDSETEDNRKNIHHLLQLAGQSFAQQTATKTFFTSIALQVEQENLSFQRFTSLQIKILNIVQEEVMANREDNKNNW